MRFGGAEALAPVSCTHCITGSVIGLQLWPPLPKAASGVLSLKYAYKHYDQYTKGLYKVIQNICICPGYSRNMARQHHMVGFAVHGGCLE
jgi:hypothetical protein